MATSPLLPQAEPVRRGPSKLLIGVAIACSLGALAAGGFALSRSKYFAPKSEQAQSEQAQPKAVKPIFVTLEPLTVNMQSEGRGRFLHIGMALKVHNEEAKAQIVEFMPELRSRLLLLLSNREPATLLSTEDKARLAEEIRVELNRPLAADAKPQDIASVSFNTFVVQ